MPSKTKMAQVRIGVAIEIFLHYINLEHWVKVNRSYTSANRKHFTHEKRQNLITLIIKTRQVMNCGADSDICQVANIT